MTLSAQGGSGLEDSSKLQQYETFPEGVFVPCADFSWTNDKYFMDVVGTKLGLDDQFASLVGGKKGGFQLNLGWDQNPNWQSNTARTPYSRGRTGRLHACPTACGSRCRTSTSPWVTPTSSNPVGIGSAPANPTVARLLRRRALGDRLLPRRPALPPQDGPGGLQRSGGTRRSCSTRPSPARRGTATRTPRSTAVPNYEVATPIDFRTDNFRLERRVREGPPLLQRLRGLQQLPNELPFVEIDNPERLELQNPANGADVLQRRVLLPPVDAPRQQGLPGRPHGRDHPARAAQGHGLAVHRQHDDGHGPPAPLDEPQPRDQRDRPEPRVHHRPALRRHRGAVRHLHGPAEAHRRSPALARLHPVLAQVRPRGQDGGVPLQQQRPGRRARVLQLVRLHAGSTRAGARTACGPRSTSVRRTACAWARSSPRRSATTTPVRTPT